MKRLRRYVNSVDKPCMQGKLTLTHPHTGETMFWETEAPEDMQQMLACIRRLAEAR